MNEPRPKSLPQKLLPWGLLVAVAATTLLFPYFILGGLKPEYAELYRRNFIVIIGLPLAAMASLFVVTFLDQASEAPIEFEGLGFKFKGASGPVILWVLCYLALAASFSMLWQNEQNRPNQTPEPTPTSVTPRADARVAPAAVVAHL